MVYMEGAPAFFARIESITPDFKPEWFHLKMLVLQVPLVVITWILRDAYINGDEFTMGGRPIRIEKVVSPEEPEEEPKEPPPSKTLEDSMKEEGASSESPEKGKVVSLFDRRRKEKD